MTADETSSSLPAVTPTPDPAPPSPGALIRMARERRRLSQEDLAQQTKLSRATVDALERDDFGALLEPVYVRGYYRKCAKILELGEEGLIAAYNRRVGPTTPRTPAKIRLSANTDGGGGWVARLVGTLLVLAALGLGAVLWYLREAPMTADAPPVPEALDTAPAAESAAAASPVTELLPSTATDAAPATGGSDTSPATASEPAVAGPAAASPTDANSANDESAPAVAGEGRVALRFTQTSWVRINDASGKTLLNGLMEAGQQQVVTGVVPLSVFLGNAPGVELRFEGEPVSLAPFVQDNNIARFNLPVER